MTSHPCSLVRILAVTAILLMSSTCVLAQITTPSTGGIPPVAPVKNPCTPRFAPGSTIQNPPALFSQNGVLNVQLSYQSTTDSVGRQLFCFMTPSGLQDPTLHVNPGDTLNVTVTNNTPFNDAGGEFDETFNPPTCGDTVFEEQGPSTNKAGFNMSGGSMNIHYHGTNTTPQCHGDNVVKTLINPVSMPGAVSTFQYNVQFPTNEPPGLYWYHPHVHGLAELAVQGGAAAALVVDGIQNVQPAVAGLRERFIMIRDQSLSVPQGESAGGTEGGIPQLDLTVNFASINTTVTTVNNVTTVTYTPAVIDMETGEQQFWRICNCTSDAPLDLQVRFDGVPQTIQIVGIDAVPVNSQDGTQPGKLIPVTDVKIPPAGRYEILVNAPPSTVKVAQLVAQLVNSGPLGDDLPTRPLLNMVLTGDSDRAAPTADDRVPAFTALNTNQQRFGGIMNVKPAVERVVFFEEHEDGTQFFMSTLSCTPSSDPRCQASAQFPAGIDVLFDNNNPPAIVTTQGSVELWHVQNHARENHELHQHQIHFRVQAQLNFAANAQGQPGAGQPAPGLTGQFADMVEVPFCGGDPAVNVTLPDGRVVQEACLTANNGGPPIPYPQVDALMDFRGPDIGDFVFHCHILGHEDRGMMAIERVVQSLP